MLKTQGLLRVKSALLLGALAMATPSQAVELISNGGFETGDFTDWVQFGDTSFQSVDGPAAHSGDFGAHFGNRSAGGVLQQSLSLTVGATYSISFWLLAQGTGTFQLFLGDNLLFTAGGLSFPYSQVAGTFVAPEADTDLRFSFSNTNGYFELDDVSLTFVSGPAIPEPASWAMMIGGFALAGGALRQRRKVAVRFA